MREGTSIEVTPELLRGRPLPAAAADGDKEDRGRVLILASSLDVPGAALLSGEAALRAGAGKVALAVPAPLAIHMGIAMPEAKVVPLQADLLPALDRIDVVLAGPGMDKALARAVTQAALGSASPALFVLDAAALDGLWHKPALLKKPRAILTPHAGEMARLCGRSKEEILADPIAAARDAAARLGSVVVLKGATTIIAAPDGQIFRHRSNVPGLATAGSGDVLAGLIAGLAARGADEIDASLWAVFLHAQAGLELARRIGTIGYLARELAGEVPALIDSFSPPSPAHTTRR